jgi:hypothetical protein
MLTQGALGGSTDFNDLASTWDINGPQLVDGLRPPRGIYNTTVFGWCLGKVETKPGEWNLF